MVDVFPFALSLACREEIEGSKGMGSKTHQAGLSGMMPFCASLLACDLWVAFGFFVLTRDS